MANDCIPYKEDVDRITGQCTVAVTGKRFLQISGSRTSGPGLSNTAEGANYRVANSGAAGTVGVGGACLGVAAWDCPLNGKVDIIREGIIPVTSGAAIAAGAEVQTDATGRAVTLTTGVRLGMCMSAVAGADVDAEILLYQ